MPAGQGMDVGDCVLHFLGDTTNLDQAFDRVATQAETKMALAAGSVKQVGTAADAAAAELTTAGESGIVAGEEITQGMRKGMSATTEARGEATLLGEAFGIHLPRHVRSFVAELPGVGTALSAAFSATAVLFLIQALVEGAEKLSNWISNTFIFTEAMKASNEALAKFNREMVDLNAQIAKAQAAFDEFGLKGTAKVAHDMDKLSESIYKNEDALAAQKDQIYGYTHGLIQMSLEDLKAAKKAAEDKKQELEKTLILQQLEMGRLQKEYDAADKDERERAAKEAEKAKKEHTKLMIAYQKEEFQTSLKYITEQQALERQLWEPLLAMMAGNLQPAAVLAQNTFGGITQALVDTKDAADKLGITLGSSLVVAVNAARKAYQDLAKTGIASSHDLMTAQLQLLHLQLQLDKAMGDVSGIKKTEQEIAKLTGQLKVFEGEEDKALKRRPNWNQFFATLVHGSLTAGQAIKQLGAMTRDGIGEAVEAAVAGSKSFGQAMEQMLKSALAALAGEAVVQSMKELALGFSALASINPLINATAPRHFLAAAKWAAVGTVAAVAGAATPGGSSSSSSAGPAGTTSPVATSAGVPGAAPSQGVNVPHLGGGALITAPTLALVGDHPSGGSRPEAIIPLGDPRAMRQLAAALGEYMGQGGGGTVQHFHIQGMISADNLHRVMRMMSSAVNRGAATLNANEARRTIRRS